VEGEVVAIRGDPYEEPFLTALTEGEEDTFTRSMLLSAYEACGFYTPLISTRGKLARLLRQRGWSYTASRRLIKFWARREVGRFVAEELRWDEGLRRGAIKPFVAIVGSISRHLEGIGELWSRELLLSLDLTDLCGSYPPILVARALEKLRGLLILEDVSCGEGGEVVLRVRHPFALEGLVEGVVEVASQEPSLYRLLEEGAQVRAASLEVLKT